MKRLMRVPLLVYCICSSLNSNARSLEEHCPPQLFASELEAVRAAADRFNPLSIKEDREYMGTIFESRGRYGYTVSSTARRGNKWQLEIPTNEWENVKAFWHTHGDARPQNRYFSDTDTMSVQKFGKPFYLADYTGYLKIFRSGDKTLNRLAASRLNLPRRSGYAIGEFVRDEMKRLVRIDVREPLRG